MEKLILMIICVLLSALVLKDLFSLMYAARLERQVKDQKAQGHDAHKAAAIKMLITVISKPLLFSDDTVSLMLGPHMREFKPTPHIISDPQYKELIEAIVKHRPKLLKEWATMSV